jgi:hypothetical protein
VAKLTATSQHRYNRLMGIGQAREERAPSLLPQALAPTIVKVGDPLQPLEDLAEAIMEGDPEGRKANRRLRQRNTAKVSFDEQGRALLYGKACCFQAMLVLNRQLDRLQLPYPWTCAECGTLFVIEMRVREVRRHA